MAKQPTENAKRGPIMDDECGDRFEAEEGADLKDAWQQAKDDGWRCYQEDGEWKHKCGECR